MRVIKKGKERKIYRKKRRNRFGSLNKFFEHLMPLRTFSVLKIAKFILLKKRS